MSANLDHTGEHLETTIMAMRMVEKLGHERALAVCRRHGWIHLIEVIVRNQEMSAA